MQGGPDLEPCALLVGTATGKLMDAAWKVCFSETLDDRKPTATSAEGVTGSRLLQGGTGLSQEKSIPIRERHLVMGSKPSLQRAW